MLGSTTKFPTEDCKNLSALRPPACLPACLLVPFLWAASAFAQPQPVPGPYTPTRMDEYVAHSPLWRTDATFRSTIRFSNQLSTASIDVIPTLYMADGTPFDLPTVHLPKSGVQTVDVNAALANVPETRRAHLSTWGSASYRYRFDWQGAVYGTMSILDAARSLEYTNSFAFPPNGGMKGVPAAVNAALAAFHGQAYEGLWFRNKSTSGGFLALSNSSAAPLTAQIELSGLKLAAGRTVPLAPHATALLDLKDFFGGDDARAGGITITHDAPPGTLQIAAGLEDLTTGYSTNLPLRVRSSTAGDIAPRQYASVGLMVNQQDPILNFPAGLTFYPYAFYRNIAAVDRTLHFAVYYMDGGNVKTLSLPDMALHPGEARELAIHDLMKNQQRAEAMNLVFSYTGAWGDIVAGTGSMDETGNYVFPVPAQPASQAGSLSSVYWLAGGGFDTMYTIWNPLPNSEELQLTVKYGTAGETWRTPLSLEPRASAMVDIGELVRTQQPDQDGKTLPLDVEQGSLLLTSAANASTDTLTAVLSGGIYNPRRATCGETCETCDGMTGQEIMPIALTVPTGGQRQSSFSYTWYDGTKYDVTKSSSWSSTASQIVSVQTQGQSSPGVAKGVSPGTADVGVVYYYAIPVNAGQICTPSGDLPPCPVTPEISDQQPTTDTPTVTIQVQSGFVSMSGNGLVVMGGAGGETSTAITAVGDPSGGSVTWTAGPNLQISGANSANASVSGTAASTSAGDTYVSVQYTSNSQSASASVRFTVLNPNALQASNFPGGGQYTTLLSGGAGYLTEVVYYLDDQLTGTAINVPGLTLTEVLTTTSNPKGAEFDPPDGQPRTGTSGADGRLLDDLSAYLPGGLPTGFSASRSQSLTGNGYPFSPAQQQTYGMTYATIATQTLRR